MINKITETVADALEGLEEGATLLLGGFGAVGQANHLIEGVLEAGAGNLVVVANNAGWGKVGLARLLREGRIRKLICSFPRIAGSTAFEEIYEAGKIELELVPQGSLAERMRAAGAGIPAFFTPTGANTLLAQGKETREFGGQVHVLETAIHGDLALVEAWEADRLGNLTYRSAGRNFNPVCATAAKRTIVQTQHLREVGEIDPEHVVTPGIFVDKVVHIPYGNPSD
ncbi:3-oxoacid CoA-transferase subunit A [Planktomarina temperata]|nr:3-oxoacid CoA-transferase subunit A [Planktomarina temperata]